MTTQDWAPLLSAAAASLAAVLAGTNLYISGRREHLSWTRSALEKALVDFLTAHYEHLDACRRLTRGAHEPMVAATEVLGTAQAADAVMMSCITRFRVLASPRLAQAALALREFNRSDQLLIESGAMESLRTQQLVTERDRKLARDTFVAEAQGVLAVKA